MEILQTKIAFFFFRRTFCHDVLDFCEQQGILPDELDHGRSIAMGDPNSR